MSAKQKSTLESGKEASASIVRYTLFLPESIFLNLELHCLVNGLKKQELIRAVLVEYLRSKGMEPEKNPNIKYSYAGR